MPGTMKAVRFHAAKDIRVDDVEIPEVKPGWVRLKPAFVGICGSDLHEYEDGPHIIPPKGSPHVMTGEGEKSYTYLSHKAVNLLTISDRTTNHHRPRILRSHRSSRRRRDGLESRRQSRRATHHLRWRLSKLQTRSHQLLRLLWLHWFVRMEWWNGRVYRLSRRVL